MQIDLSNHELEMLDKALVSWQKEPSREGFSEMLLSVMFRNKETPQEQREADMKAEREKLDSAVQQRERQVLMLRAKLVQASNRISEHDPIDGAHV